MKTLSELTSLITAFRDERDWKQYHTVKDMLISLMIEASELAEHFQWKNEDQIREYLESNRENISHELADVLYWVLLIANDLDIDLENAFLDKMEINRNKYPADKVRGKSAKYTEYS
ncbi:MAG: nucleotide pyrophosphohydrolase [Candidatus Dadabacteria bacterium]|nr:MAG: nucleotide pyrophosphohydrolase [Candidatus Dadabacteria bacterium]